MILSAAADKKAVSHFVHRTPQPKKQKHFEQRYEIETSQQKKQEPAVTEKWKGFNELSNPTATKKAENKN